MPTEPALTLTVKSKIDPRYWRIRIKYGSYENLTRDAWERDEVGIWYGAWTATDLQTALKSESSLTYLSTANSERGLAWKVPFREPLGAI